ncbi:MAG: hypothetical protein M1834_001745 [Cirrosporium novae-zelandiae]|nr:MAG: hypothetical protein M1834_001745 [Cirrosporium novae-zelandiae]
MTSHTKLPINSHFSNPSNLNEDFDLFNNSGNLAGTGDSSPFIKDEPDDSGFNPNRFSDNQHLYDMNSHQFGQNFNQGIDPSELTMQNDYPFGSQHNMTSSFHMGNSGVIGDDELIDLDLNGQQGNQNGMNGYNNEINMQRNDTGMTSYFPNQGQPTGMDMSQQNRMTHMYSNTPEGAPIQSPFVHGFNYEQFRSLPSQQLPQHASPQMRPSSGQRIGSFENSYMSKPRPAVPQNLDRKLSDSRSPMTPKTPALAGLHLGTPDSTSFQSQPIQTMQHRHQKSLSNQWDSNPGSLHSYVESPISSPGHPSHHAQISEVIKSGKHASLPAKVDIGPGHGTTQTQEAKRRRRRESHNLVERRRRDNINERIQDLSRLVPQHRLEDEKVRKHLANNSPISPTIGATSISPPQATSLLAGGTGRRATGNITMGIPIEEKEKGPNKGDILNGAVGWTRDLMWALYQSLQRESDLVQYLSDNGLSWPYEQSEEEKRMRTELFDAMEKNDPATFAYSRAPGSGLRVPKHTNIAGESVNPPTGTLSPQSLSPAFQSGGSGTNSGSTGVQQQPQFWGGGGSGHAAISFKEEDEELADQFMET